MESHMELWLKKFRTLSKENEEDWLKVFKSVKNSEKKEKAIISYLRWNLEKDDLVDLPCYTRPAVQDDFRKRIRECCQKWGSSDDDTEIGKILAPFTIHPHWRLSNEDTEIVRLLAPLTENPNAPDEHGRTPIYYAAMHGHTEIFKILAPLTDNPNVPDKYGETPICWAARNGNTEIVKILAPLTDDPNAPDKATNDENGAYLTEFGNFDEEVN